MSPRTQSRTRDSNRRRVPQETKRANPSQETKRANPPPMFYDHNCEKPWQPPRDDRNEKPQEAKQPADGPWWMCGRDPAKSRLKRRLTRIEATANLAISLSRNYHGRHFTALQNTFNAVAIVSAGVSARRAIEAGKSAEKAYGKAEAIAKWYSSKAKVLRRDELPDDSYVLGLLLPVGPDSLATPWHVW